MTVHIKLYGSKADRFEEIKAELTDQLGYEPSNPEVVGLLMGSLDAEGAAVIEVPARQPDEPRVGEKG